MFSIDNFLSNIPISLLDVPSFSALKETYEQRFRIWDFEVDLMPNWSASLWTLNSSESADVLCLSVWQEDIIEFSEKSKEDIIEKPWHTACFGASIPFDFTQSCLLRPFPIYLGLIYWRSINDLINLKYTSKITLPSSIWKANKLWHLYMNDELSIEIFG